jgi:rhodanese-related sulfurtransferase
MNKHEAIYAVVPTAVVIRGDEAFDADGNLITYSELAVQAHLAANAYKDQRAAEYPSIPDQLDMLYHGGYDAWKATVKAVKDKYPKGAA